MSSAYEAGQLASATGQVGAQGASFSIPLSRATSNLIPDYMHTRHIAGDGQYWSHNDYVGSSTPTDTVPVTLCTVKRLLTEAVAETRGIQALARLDAHGIARVAFSRGPELFKPVPRGKEVPITSYDRYLVEHEKAELEEEVAVAFPHPLNRGQMAFAAGAVVLRRRGRLFIPVPSTVVDFDSEWGLNQLSFVR